ncbi:MAG: acetyltransferase, partial [Nitrososphaeraceae archaeon]|nr:acetyltransferase [Nitrososphaeraceae archaeon]
MKKDLILYGIGKFSQYVRYLFENDSDYNVIGYCIEEKLWGSSSFDNKPLMKFEDLHQDFPPESYELFIAVGNNKLRERFFTLAKQKGYNLASYISSKAQFWPDLETGENVFIGEGSTIHPFVSIRDNSFLICANIAHHCKIGKHCLLSVSTLGGDVSIGNNSFLGMNSTIKHGLSIGENSIIGMNACIEKNTQPNSVIT